MYPVCLARHISDLIQQRTLPMEEFDSEELKQVCDGGCYEPMPLQSQITDEDIQYEKS